MISFKNLLYGHLTCLVHLQIFMFLKSIIDKQLLGAFSRYYVNYRDISLTPLTVCVENMSSRQPTSLMSTGSLSSLGPGSTQLISPPPPPRPLCPLR